MFTITGKDSKTSARTGILSTAHGVIQTPCYVMVATHGTVKTLSSEDVFKTKTEALIANTYHLWQEQLPEIEKAGGLHEFFGWESMPLMTDSGGFQVFSFGFAREHKTGKVGSTHSAHELRIIKKRLRKDKNLVTITDAGVRFSITNKLGKKSFAMLTPERSMDIQKKLGADIIFAFDECTSPLHDRAYTVEALRRTYAWAILCLNQPRRPYQKLYGIVQGGEFRDLREESARSINGMGFDGFGIGGSFGESYGRQNSDVKNVLEWTIPHLDEKKPRHLLGIGAIKDMFEAISLGIDTFDCVIPTREGRHGSIWTHEGRYDIRNSENRTKKEPLERTCTCSACTSTTRKDLSDMFRAKDANAGRFATIHNMYFFNTLMEETRKAIREGMFNEHRKKILRTLASGA